VSEEDKARSQLHKLADTLEAQAFDAHAEGTMYTAASARIRQLTCMAEDKDIIELRDRIIAQELCAVDESYSAPGGDA
jgi:hypothetical protein